MLESIANRILIVGGHPLQLCFKHPNEQNRNHTLEDHEQVVIEVGVQQNKSMMTSIRARTTTTINNDNNNNIRDDDKEEEEQEKNVPYYCGCRIDSPMYSRCWPFFILFSAITDFSFPLPSDKKPSQHRYWGWISVCVVLSIIAFLYYGYSVHLCLTLIYQGSMIQVTINLISVHLLLLLLLTSYARIVTKRPGTPKKTIMTMMKRNDILSQQETSRPFYKSILPQRWCELCQWWKPDRAHHCSVCNTCVLRMDHHCQWVNGCVGFDNYRYYIQFIFYTSGTSFWVFTTSLTAFIMGNGLATYNKIVIVVILLSGLIMVSVGMLTFSHLWLITLNRTTIENLQFHAWKNQKNTSSVTQSELSQPPPMFTTGGKCIFNRGITENWIEIMGDRWLYWFLPLGIKLKCNGYEFDYNENIYKGYGTVSL